MNRCSVKSVGQVCKMSKQELLRKFKEDVTKLRNIAKEANIPDAEVDEIFRNGLAVLRNAQKQMPQKRSSGKFNFISFLKLCLITTMVLLVIYVVLNVHQPTSSIVLRNVQGLIHPGFKFLRLLSVPIITIFPSLTTLYDESCLIENPYFYVSDMECWPCKSVHSVVDLSGFNNFSLHKSGVPYIIKTNQEIVTVDHLKDLYETNQEIFRKDANYIKAKSFVNLSDFFKTNVSLSDHYSWRINRMNPARMLRKLFPKPHIVSNWTGQSMERYVMIDGAESGPYAFPNFECSYVFVIQSTGVRTVILKPSRECMDECKTVSVILKPSYILWYNWWYWRPISLPTENATDISISYISSYC